MDADLSGFSYFACAVLIVVYAWSRFNTPPSNRSSTRQTLYWSSCAGYLLSALALFVALVILLKAGPWRKFLLGPHDDATLPVPLAAALAMTTLLPSIPLLRRVDEWFLSIFLDWAEIPEEVKRRAAGMTPESYSVSREDVTLLRKAYGDGSWGDTLASHLRKHAEEGLALSQFRLTRVVKLHCSLRKLAAEPRYGAFFVEADSEWAELDRKTGDFLRRAATSLTLAQRFGGLGPNDANQELIEERRADFARECGEIFGRLALFLARAVLRSETGQEQIVQRLRATGFQTAGVDAVPHFPIHSLTVLALGVFLYLVLAVPFFTQVLGIPEQKGGAMMIAAKVSSVRLLTVGTTVWLMQRYAFFRRRQGEPLRFFAYAVNGGIAALVAAAIALSFHAGDADPLKALPGDLPLILLSFLLCAAVAFCCDDWVHDRRPPAWLRFAEAGGCAAAVAAGMGIVVIYLSDNLRLPAAVLHGWRLALLIAMPSALALVIGACVPAMYRAANAAAAARRGGFAPPLPADEPEASAAYATVTRVAGRLAPAHGLSPARSGAIRAGAYLSGECRRRLRAADAQHQQRGEETGKTARHEGQEIVAAEAAHSAGAEGRQRPAELMAGKDPGNDDRRVAAAKDLVG